MFGQSVRGGKPKTKKPPASTSTPETKLPRMKNVYAQHQAAQQAYIQMMSDDDESSAVGSSPFNGDAGSSLTSLSLYDGGSLIGNNDNNNNNEKNGNSNSNNNVNGNSNNNIPPSPRNPHAGLALQFDPTATTHMPPYNNPALALYHPQHAAVVGELIVSSDEMDEQSLITAGEGSTTILVMDHEQEQEFEKKRENDNQEDNPPIINVDDDQQEQEKQANGKENDNGNTSTQTNIRNSNRNRSSLNKNNTSFDCATTEGSTSKEQKSMGSKSSHSLGGESLLLGQPASAMLPSLQQLYKEGDPANNNNNSKTNMAHHHVRTASSSAHYHSQQHHQRLSSLSTIDPNEDNHSNNPNNIYYDINSTLEDGSTIYEGEIMDENNKKGATTTTTRKDFTPHIPNKNTKEHIPSNHNSNKTNKNHTITPTKQMIRTIPSSAAPAKDDLKIIKVAKASSRSTTNNNNKTQAEGGVCSCCCCPPWVQEAPLWLQIVMALAGVLFLAALAVTLVALWEEYERQKALGGGDNDSNSGNDNIGTAGSVSFPWNNDENRRFLRRVVLRMNQAD